MSMLWPCKLAGSVAHTRRQIRRGTWTVKHCRGPASNSRRRVAATPVVPCGSRPGQRHADRWNGVNRRYTTIPASAYGRALRVR